MKKLSLFSIPKLWLLLVLTFFSICFYSQTTIKGHLGDEESGEDLIGASIKILGSKYGCVQLAELGFFNVV